MGLNQTGEIPEHCKNKNQHLIICFLVYIKAGGQEGGSVDLGIVDYT